MGIYENRWPMLAILFLLSPCVQATPVDSGAMSPCTGIIITTQQAKQALQDRAELKARRDFACPECPACLPCPKPQPLQFTRWAAGGAIAGVISALLLALLVR